ncbi:MAG TPA: hypothetical protein VNQ32_05315 [Steroidobacteraceae bacterium]|nr:hypothetical protein [Steroidobacteraceae bacterium]
MQMRHLTLLASAAVLAACSAGSANDYPTKGPEAVLGIWVPDEAPQQLRTVDGKAPPLTADAADLRKARLEKLAAGDTSFDQTNWCASPGMPRVLTMPYPFEIRSDGDYLAFIHGWYRTHRVVDMKGEPVDPPLPLTMGFANGHWEGDTLVIRTTGLIDATIVDASGLPRSEEMVLTERLRVLPDGRLEDRITIEDPQTFTQPWETVLHFHRERGAQVTDDICPDRIANGEPAVRKSVPSPATAAPKPAKAAADTKDAAPAPRFSGIWEPRTFGIMVPEAKLSAAGKAMMDRATSRPAGSIMHTAWTSCRPGAVSTMTMPREKIVVLQSPQEVTIVYEMPRMTRRIRINGTHPEKLEPSYVGDSIGKWEGNTLVVDSIGFNGYAELDAMGQPTSAQLHTVERFTLAEDGSAINIEVTITDPEYYSEPFTIKRAWRPSNARLPFEYDCMENPRSEDFENAFYVHDRYRPTCMRIEGEGMELSKVVCRPQE